MRPLQALAIGLILGAAPANAQWAEVPSSELSLLSEIRGDGPYAFLTGIHKAVLTPRKTLLVYDVTELTLLEFSLDGRLLQKIGREGGGPGEFRRIDDFGFLGDSLWVWDMRQQRVTWFNEGEVLGTQRVGESTLAVVPFTFVGDERVFSFSWGSPDQSEVVARVSTASGQLVETVATFPEGAPLSVQAELFGRPNRIRNVFSDSPVRVHSATGRSIAIVIRPRPEKMGNSRFRVIRYSRGETQEATLHYKVLPLAEYELAEQSRIVDAYYEGLGRRIGTPRSAIRKDVQEALETPEYALPVYGAEVDSAARIWLAVTAQPTVMEWVWLDGALKPAGRIHVPANEAVLEIEEGLVITQRADEWEVPHLRVYSVKGLSSK